MKKFYNDWIILCESALEWIINCVIFQKKILMNGLKMVIGTYSDKVMYSI